jgi:hypothetical protein
VEIQKGEGATVTDSTIGGNYQCSQCGFADLFFSSVAGNFQDNGLMEGAFIRRNTIGGNLEIHNSLGGGFGFTVLDNSVGGNVHFDNNSGEPSSNLGRNAINGNLQCQGNTPPPTGAGNTAKQKQGQCAGL